MGLEQEWKKAWQACQCRKKPILKDSLPAFSSMAQSEIEPNLRTDGNVIPAA
jgi:hypothetical protein